MNERKYSPFNLINEWNNNNTNKNKNVNRIIVEIIMRAFK